jgi:hypothetical protein
MRQEVSLENCLNRPVHASDGLQRRPAIENLEGMWPAYHMSIYRLMQRRGQHLWSSQRSRPRCYANATVGIQASTAILNACLSSACTESQTAACWASHFIRIAACNTNIRNHNRYENAPAFNAIASRDFVIVKPDGSKIPVHVAIGAPYRPAKHARAGNKVGCLVLTCDDPDLATEIWGSDEMDVVAIALALIDIHLIQMIKETGVNCKSSRSPCRSIGFGSLEGNSRDSAQDHERFIVVTWSNPQSDA